MLGWSISIGKIFGVELRLHAFFLLLLPISVAWASTLNVALSRGFALWLLLLLAVLVRETARALAAAWFSLDLRSLLLLPTGGLFTFANPDSLTRAASPRVQRRMALVGPIASFAFAALLAGIVLAVSPTVDLYSPRWVSPEHLVRTMIWVNLLLGALNLLPAWPLDGGRVMRTQLLERPGRPADSAAGNSDKPDRPEIPAQAPQSTRAQARLQRLALSRISQPRLLAGIGPFIALLLIFFGLFNNNWWLIMAGLGIFLGAQIERQGLLLRTDLDQVLVRDIMLTDYSVLSASSTLEDALDRARHSLQDVFPVVRGGNMVGAIARHTILEHIQLAGNSYVQGHMTRSFATASPAEPIILALARIPATVPTTVQLLPVVDGDRIVGIITPQNLQRSMAILPTRTPPEK